MDRKGWDASLMPTVEEAAELAKVNGLDCATKDEIIRAARVLSGRWPKNVVNKSVRPKVKLVKES